MIDMMKGVIIRPEEERDFHGSELAAKLAFWNLHQQGCDEHLLVNKLRRHESYIPSLTRVAEYEGEIIGGIYYAVAHVENTEVLTFGPLCVIPKYENRGVGGALLRCTLEEARKMGYPGIVIYGEPGYYPRFGFKTTDHFGITREKGGYAPSLMGYEFAEGALSAIPGRFFEPSPYSDLPEREVAELESDFPYMPKRKRAGQWSD